MKPNTDRKILQYSEEQMENALNAVRNKRISVRKASRIHRVPKTTLLDKLHGRVPEGRKMGRDPFLGCEGEDHLVLWIKNQCKRGAPAKYSDVLNSAKQIVKKHKLKTPFVDDRPGRNWFKSFMKRNPSLSVRTHERISFARSNIEEKDIRQWFTDLEGELRNLDCFDIFSDPSRIFNMDETCIELSPKTGQVIGIRGWKNIYEVAPEPEKSNLTFLGTFSASGEIVTPDIIFPYVRIPFKLTKTVPSHWFIGASESGWMKTETFYEYIANAFIPWINERQVRKPVILFVDGHKTHTSIEVSMLCKENDIILYLLPPNTTHILQPADVGQFKPLKQLWKEEVHSFELLNPESSLSRKEVCPLLDKVLGKLSKSSIINGFKATGLYPFDPDRPKYESLIDEGANITLDDISNGQTLSITDNIFQLTEREKYNCALTVLSEELGEDIVEQLNSDMTFSNPISQKLQKSWKNMKAKLEMNCDDAIDFNVAPLDESFNLQLSNKLSNENEDTTTIFNKILINSSQESTDTSTKNNIAQEPIPSTSGVHSSFPGTVTYKKRKCPQGKVYYNISSEKYRISLIKRDKEENVSLLGPQHHGYSWE